MPADSSRKPRPAWRKYLLPTIRFVVPVGILSWLVFHIDPGTWRQLLNPRDGRLLVASFLLTLLGVSITHIRWYLLVRALHMPFGLGEGLRLGFLCYLLNFVSVGAVGGDIYKAFFIARRQPTRRAEAVATVFVDRMFGLYALLLVASAAILLSDLQGAKPVVRTIMNMTLLITSIGAVGIMLIMVPGFTAGSVSEMLTNLPRVGPTIGSLISAVRMYRSRPGILAAIGMLSIVVHCLFALALYFIAAALFAPIPTLSEHLVIVPLSLVVGAVPISPAGLGTTELAMSELYQLIPSGEAARIPGSTIALVFRAVTVGIAAVGIIFYWTSRREVQTVIHEAEQQAEAASGGC